MITATVVMLGLVAGLVAKYMWVISVQAHERLRLKQFRWPEDLEHFGGEAIEPESAIAHRAQAVLRNDSESQWLFVGAAAIWLQAGAHPQVGLGVVLAYVCARTLHAYWLIHPRQPLRNRAFAVSGLLLFGVLADSARLLCT